MPQTDDTDETTAEPKPTDEELEHHWIAVLAEYWLQTDWDQFGQQKKSRADTFGERIEVASRAGGVHEALSKLARGLGMASPELPTADLDPLVADESRSMRMLRRESIWLVNKADETVQNYFDAKSEAEDSTDTDDSTGTTTDLSDFITTGDDE